MFLLGSISKPIAVTALMTLFDRGEFKLDDAGLWLANTPDSGARDVRLRVALRHSERPAAERLMREGTALYTSGPAGGGGVRTAIRPTLGMLSGLLPREAVPARFVWLR